MLDRVTTVGGSVIQHGPDSDRVYLMEMEAGDMPGLLLRINDLARKENYGKIFAKVPARWVRVFRADGFCTEARVPGFFRGEEDGHFMGKYLDRDRAADDRQGEMERILALARRHPEGRCEKTAPAVYTIRRCVQADCDAMAQCFRNVFDSYPFPVDDPAFLAESMADNVLYMGAWHESGELAALASAEQYRQSGHVEMTDFLTVPRHRRRGLARRLLVALEREMQQHGRLAVAYTIARALSAGMNITFARAGYRHAGTLINNTQICGGIESMQVWYKPLAADS